MQQTTQQNALNFVALLSEGLPYVDAWTPTCINEGGCGVFAQLLSEELSKHNIEHKIYALYFNDDKDYEDNLKRFLQTGQIKDKDMTGANHVCICINNLLYVDSCGIINKEVAMAIDKIEMTLDQLKGLVEKGGWNEMFDRECIPFIREHIQEVFTHLDDFHSGMFKFPGKQGVEYTQYTIRKRQEMSSFSSVLQSLFR